MIDIQAGDIVGIFCPGYCLRIQRCVGGGRCRSHSVRRHVRPHSGGGRPAASPAEIYLVRSGQRQRPSPYSPTTAWTANFPQNLEGQQRTVTKAAVEGRTITQNIGVVGRLTFWNTAAGTHKPQVWFRLLFPRTIIEELGPFQYTHNVL